MGDTSACAHHLNIAGGGAAFVTQAVTMSDRSCAHESDNLHVAVRMRGEPGLTLDRVIVPDPDVAPPHTVGIMIIGKAEMMTRIEPAVIGVPKGSERTNIDHGQSLTSAGC